MTKNDETHNKVIDLFHRHRKGEAVDFHLGEGEQGGELADSPDGFHYISFRYDMNDTPAKETELLEMAEARHYVFRMLEHHKEAIRVNNYYVPGERLGEFLATLPNRPGRILEVKSFFPDTMA